MKNSHRKIIYGDVQPIPLGTLRFVPIGYLHASIINAG